MHQKWGWLDSVSYFCWVSSFNNWVSSLVISRHLTEHYRQILKRLWIFLHVDKRTFPLNLNSTSTIPITLQFTLQLFRIHPDKESHPTWDSSLAWRKPGQRIIALKVRKTSWHSSFKSATPENNFIKSHPIKRDKITTVPMNNEWTWIFSNHWFTFIFSEPVPHNRPSIMENLKNRTGLRCPKSLRCYLQHNCCFLGTATKNVL